MRQILLVLFLLFACLFAREINTDIFRRIVEHVPEGKVLTITDFRGNYATEFTKAMMSYLQVHRNISFIDFDIHRMVLEEQMRFSEPVFDDKFTDEMPQLISPDIGIIGSANQQRSNILFKQREHLDYEINLVDLNTGLILLNLNDRIQTRYNPPLLLLGIMIVLILAIARWIIHLKKGYNVFIVICIASFFVVLIVVWYLL
jgi:hypothetical protein